MGFGLGWKSSLQSIAQTLAQLVGQDIAARSITTTGVSASTIAGSLVVGGNGVIRGVSVAGSALDLSGTQAQLTTASGASGIQFVNGTGTGTVTGILKVAQGLTLTSLLQSPTAPTVVAGAGASVTASNGSAVFSIGLGGVASTGTITFPTAATGWVVYMQNITHPDANVMGQTGFTTTTATFTNYVRTTGVAGNWSANDVALCIALAY